MLSTVHVHNWKAPGLVTAEGVKTVCSRRRPPSALAQTPGETTCPTCGLRVLREGQDRGLSEDDIKTWTWEQLGATPPPQETTCT